MDNASQFYLHIIGLSGTLVYEQNFEIFLVKRPH